MDLKNLSSNWKKLQASLAAEKAHSDTSKALKRKRNTLSASASKPQKRARLESGTKHKKPKLTRHKMEQTTEIEQKISVPGNINAGLSESVEIGKYVALDCEMVGVGPMGEESALARVSIVNYNGEQIYDSFVAQKEAVVDWRTAVSGIKESHMKEARTFEDVQNVVAEILKGRIVVGHSLRHDFRALLLDHPLRDIRDTSKLPAYRKVAGGTPKLSLLASQLLGLEIQSGEHSSLEDARACMLLFKRDKDKFEVWTGKPRGKKK